MLVARDSFPKYTNSLYSSMSKKQTTQSKKWAEGFPGGAVVESLPANAGTRVQALVWEDPTCRGAAGPVSHNC